MKIKPFKMTVTNEQSKHVQEILAGFGIGWCGMNVREYQNIGKDHYLLYDGTCLTWSDDDWCWINTDLPELSYDQFIETTTTLYQYTDIIEKYLLMNEREVYTRTKRSDIKNWLILNS